MISLARLYDRLLAHDWMRRYVDSGSVHPCEHGHVQCSIQMRGPCLEEMLRLHGEPTEWEEERT